MTTRLMNTLKSVALATAMVVMATAATSRQIPDPPNRESVVIAEWDRRPANGSEEDAKRFVCDVAAELRAQGQPEWGVNWKRAEDGDQTIDIIAWKPDGASDTQARIVDIIAGASPDPGEEADPSPTWIAYSAEEAGDVYWVWPGPCEVDGPDDPDEPGDPPPTNPIAQLLAGQQRLAEQITALETRLATIEAKQDRPLEGRFRLWGYTAVFTVIARD